MELILIVVVFVSRIYMFLLTKISHTSMNINEVQIVVFPAMKEVMEIFDITIPGEA